MRCNSIQLFWLGCIAFCLTLLGESLSNSAEPLQPVAAFLIHPDGGVNAGQRVCLSADGKFVLQAENFQEKTVSGFAVTEFSVATGQKVRDLYHANSVQALDLAFSPDRKLLAYCVQSNPAQAQFQTQVIDLTTGKARTPLPVRASRLAFSTDNKLLVTAQETVGLQVWNLSTAKQVFSQADAAGLRDLGISSDGTLVAWLANHAPRSVRLIDVAQRKEKDTLPYDKDLLHLAISPDSKTLIATGNQQVLFWDLTAKNQTTAIRLQPIGGQSPTLSPDGKWLVCDLETRKGQALANYALFIDLATGTPKGYITLSGTTHSYFSLSADSKLFLAVDTGNLKATKAYLYDTSPLETDLLDKLLPAVEK